MECIECKHMKKVKSSQPCISLNSCTELSETKFFPVSTVKDVKAMSWSLRYS